jgi:hypothetical protein
MFPSPPAAKPISYRTLATELMDGSNATICLYLEQVRGTQKGTERRKEDRREERRAEGSNTEREKEDGWGSR